MTRLENGIRAVKKYYPEPKQSSTWNTETDQIVATKWFLKSRKNSKHEILLWDKSPILIRGYFKNIFHSPQKLTNSELKMVFRNRVWIQTITPDWFFIHFRFWFDRKTNIKLMAFPGKEPRNASKNQVIICYKFSFKAQ